MVQSSHAQVWSRRFWDSICKARIIQGRMDSMRRCAGYNLGKQKKDQLLHVYGRAFTSGHPGTCIMKKYVEKYVSASNGTKCLALIVLACERVDKIVN